MFRRLVLASRNELRRGLRLNLTESTTIQLASSAAAFLDFEDHHFPTDRHIFLPDLTEVDDTETATLDQRRVVGVGVLSAALLHARRNPTQFLLCAGHTDASASADHNLKLSHERARNVSLLLRAEREEWAQHNRKVDIEDDYATVLRWQDIRTKDGSVDGPNPWDCDPGVGDFNRLLTAIGNFQKAYNARVRLDTDSGEDTPYRDRPEIAEDKAVGEEVWKAFYDVYFSEVCRMLNLGFSEVEALQQQLTSLPDTPDFVGCGENFPYDLAQREDFEEGDPAVARPEHLRLDRRVDVLFFDPGEEQPLLCHPDEKTFKPELCPLYGARKGFLLRPIGIPTGLDITEVNLRLTFEDPEGVVRPFPAGIAVEARFGDPDVVNLDPEVDPAIITDDPRDAPEETVDQTPEIFTQADGLLRFDIARAASSFHLVIRAGRTQRFISASRTDPNDQRLVDEAEAVDLVGTGRVYWALPVSFDSKAAFFRPPTGVTFRDGQFQDLDDKETEFGTRDAPIELRLQVRWQHFRFEYFDRFAARVSAVPQPRSTAADGTRVPPLALEGFLVRPTNATQPPLPAVAAAWDVGDGDNTVHCLGWPAAAGSANARRTPPDNQVMVAFRRIDTNDQASLFVRRNENDTRSFVRFNRATDTAPRTPGIERLRLYDLPSRWWSRDYPARLSNEDLPAIRAFEQLANTATTPTRPIVFSLDTIVLSAEIPEPQRAGEVPPVTGDRTIQYDDTNVERRITLYDANLQVHLPDQTGNREIYFTRVPAARRQPDGPVWHDHPPFTRLISRSGILYDVFGDRLPLLEDNLGLPIGARLGRRFALDETENDGTSMVRFPHQPFMPNGTRPGDVGNGFAAAVLLRCCGRDGNVELFKLVQWGMIRFDATPANPIAEGTVGATVSDREARDCIVAVNARWTGQDGALVPSRIRFEVGPANAVTARGEYHLLLGRSGDTTENDVVINVYQSMTRPAHMTANSSVGHWPKDRMLPSADGGLTAAHEVGHTLGLPDEYLRRRTGPSLFSPDTLEAARSPGTPYGLDLDSMMGLDDRVPRARHFWHLVLFARSDNSARGHFRNASITIVQNPNRFTADITPENENRERVPILRTVQANGPVSGIVFGTRGRCDPFVYLAGPDGFIDDADGIIAIRVKLAVAFADGDFTTQRGFLSDASGRSRRELHTRRQIFARGVLGNRIVTLRLLVGDRWLSTTFPTTESGSQNDLPGYLRLLDARPPVTNAATYQTFVDDVLDTHGVNCIVNVGGSGTTPGVTPSGPTDAAARRAAVRGTTQLDFSRDSFLVFCQLLGLPDASAATLANPESYRPLFERLANPGGAELAGTPFVLEADPTAITVNTT